MRPLPFGWGRFASAAENRLCKKLGEHGDAFCAPMDGDLPYLWGDPTQLKVRQGGCIVSVVMRRAADAHTAGCKAVLSMAKPLLPNEYGNYFLASVTR